MILRLALRELWHLRTALLLQVAGLTVAIATFAASTSLDAQTRAGSVPGSNCSDQVLDVSALDGAGAVRIGWTPRQMQVLLKALGTTAGAEVMPTVARLNTPLGPQEIGAAFVGPAFFDVVCVARRDTLGKVVQQPFTDGAVLAQAIAKGPSAAQTLQASGGVLTPGQVAVDFRGLEFREQPQDAWMPAAIAWAGGADFLALDAPVFRLLARPQGGETAAALEAKLRAAIHEQPTLFKGIVAVQAGPTLQINAWAAQKIALATNLLRIFAGGLLMLVLVNFLTYNAGRLPGMQALASTLGALGVPPAALWQYAAVEPALVGSVSLLLGLALGTPLGYVALAAVTNEAADLASGSGAHAWLWPALLATGLTAAIVYARGRLLLRRQAPARGRAQRQVLRLLPALLTLQIVVAGTTLTLAAQATVGLVKALPPSPNFPLQGLSMVTVRKPEHARLEQHLLLRWPAAWQTAQAPVGYQAALATSQAPFLPNVGAYGAAGQPGHSVQGTFDQVSANFFQVLGADVPGAARFRADATEVTKGGQPVSAPMILSRQMAQALANGQSTTGMLVRTTRDPNKPLTLDDPVSPVVGEFDDGIIGARGAVATFSLSQLSMQAALPLAYMPLDTLHQVTALVMFVRHPPTATPAQIRAAVTPALTALIPGASIEDVTSATVLFRNPLRKERTMATVLGILAAATLAVGLLGMVALMTMLLRSLRVEFAVRYAVGASRTAVATQLLKRMLPPTAAGLAIAALISAGGLFVLVQALETAGRAGAWGPTLGLVAIVGTYISVLLFAARKIVGANFMDWLRYE